MRLEKKSYRAQQDSFAGDEEPSKGDLWQTFLRQQRKSSKKVSAGGSPVAASMIPSSPKNQSKILQRQSSTEFSGMRLQQATNRQVKALE